MTVHITVPAIAAGRYPHGSPVRLVDGRAFLELDLDRIDGFTKRPCDASDRMDHEEGEQLHVLTDGGQLSVIDQQPRWTVVTGGRLVR